MPKGASFASFKKEHLLMQWTKKSFNVFRNNPYAFLFWRHINVSWKLGSRSSLSENLSGDHFVDAYGNQELALQIVLIIAILIQLISLIIVT